MSNNFCRKIEISLVSCKISILLGWSKKLIFSHWYCSKSTANIYNSRYKTLCSCYNFFNSTWNKSIETIRVRFWSYSLCAILPYVAIGGGGKGWGWGTKCSYLKSPKLKMNYQWNFPYRSMHPFSGLFAYFCV